jgi:cell wall-associated NlpC family hydrolase
MGQAAPQLPYPLQRFANGSSHAPQRGDVLIFHENAGRSGPGHVAVVIGVNRTTGRLTFVGENQWQAPTVVCVPISTTDQVSTQGFSSGLHVSLWLHNPAWSWPGGISTTIAPAG